jgi:hypothetical protein
MGLLDKLQTAGSNFSAYDGKNPTKYDGVSQYQKDLATSQLDLEGKTPTKYNGVSNYQKGLATSQLDLEGKTPNKYTDNLPK